MKEFLEMVGNVQPKLRRLLLEGILERLLGTLFCNREPTYQWSFHEMIRLIIDDCKEWMVKLLKLSKGWYDDFT